MKDNNGMVDVSQHTPMMHKYLYIDLYNKFLTKS